MEDILQKNIFDDKDLCKLDPDYVPTDIFLRMQIRSTTVMDTHRHTRNKEIRQNNNLQRVTRNSCIVNKEISKTRYGYQKMNIKNQIMLKEAINCVAKSNPKNLQTRSDQEDYKNLKEDTDLCFEELLRDMTNNLVICNDTEFKINDQPMAEVNQFSRKTKNFTVRKKENNAIKTYDNSTEDILRIECSYHKYLENKTKDDFIGYITQEQEEPDKNMTIASPHFGEKVNDLQSLLIMMAISPKSNESEENVEMNEINNKCSVYKLDVLEKEEMKMPIMVTSEDITNIMSIKPLRAEISNRQKYIMEKYVKKWKTCVTNKPDYQLRERQATLDIFFDKLAKKKSNRSPETMNKAKLLAKDYNTYQHRYKVQKHIIAIQKAKLEEQNRLIEELKYNKIVKSSRQSVDEMREEVRKAYYEIDRQLKPKIKCLTNELKVHDIHETSLVLHCLKVPQFLQRMEKRAREREEKHAMIRERRKQMEEERIRLKQHAELAKVEMDKEEKTKRIQELKEKRKREKIEGIRKKQHAERMRALKVMADLHYEKYLMAKYGIRPLRLLAGIKRDNMEKAKAHYTFQLKKNIFLHWMWHTEDMLFERSYIAEEFHRKKMSKKVFNGLKKNHHEYVVKKQVAEDYYDFYITKMSYKMFCEGIQMVRKENKVKLQKAEKYCNSNLLFKTFICWRTLPALNALQREQETRKARWREKVLLVVPDYTPPDE